MPGARARHRATPPARLPACLPLPSSSGWPGTTPRPPLLSLTLPRFFLSSPSLSLSRVRTHPSPPFAIAAATGLPSPPRHAPQLRRDPLFLPTKPSPSGSSASPPRHRLRPRAPTTIAVDSPSPARPRARFDAHCNRGELRHRFPLFSPSFPRRNPVSHHGRTSAVAELAVDAAPVTIWSRACTRGACRDP